MLNEEDKKSLIEEIFTFKKEDEEISDEDLKLAEELIETHQDLTDLDRKIVKLRIFRGMTYRRITEILQLRRSHTAHNRFNQSIRKIRKSLRESKRPDDGTEKLTSLMKSRNHLLALRRADFYTIGQLTNYLKNHGTLKVVLPASQIASIIYYLDRDGHDLRNLVTDKRLLEEFEELDRRNYVQVDQLQDLIKSQKSVNLVERATNSYTSSSKTEFGSFDVFLSNGSKVRLRATIKSLEGYYELSTDVESSKKYERFDYSDKMTHSVSTNSENLEEALQFLLLAASTN